MALERFAGKNVERDDRCQAAAIEAGHPDWWSWVRALEEEKDRTICGSPLRKKFRPCAQHPAVNGRCMRYHGGNTPIGPASPHFVDGHRSKMFPYLPHRLQERAEEMYGDSELIACREQIATLTARSEEVLAEGLTTGESGAAWRALGDLYRQLVFAQDDDDEKKAADCMRLMKMILSQGIGEDAAWRDYERLVETIRRQRETEMSRLKQLGALMKADRVKAMMVRLLDIMREHVRDTQTLRLILLAVDREFGRGAKTDSGGGKGAA